MNIRNLFEKKIERPINGVIKADQRDPESIWQELDEYVITPQLTEYFRRFLDSYLAGFDRPNDPVISSRMGCWVSGFFGSGKSHFIKILSYLLENIEAVDPISGSPKKAAAFFDSIKVKDAMLLADIQRAAMKPVDVILFNIDAKADSKTDRDVILQVFLRVFNEKMGFSGDAPHIANMERHLVSKGAYEAFKTAFSQSNGSSWDEQRDAVDFLRDDVVHALSVALGMSDDSAASWFDTGRDTYRINIENFAQLVNEYLQTKPAEHRLLFLVDEVGQFIGEKTELMLNLQTLTEQLGTLCHGRAWVIVTSQEDIDSAIGEANKSKSQDFSKIQGRFHTRLSLASSNTDEVIGQRLLLKTEQAHQELRDVFASKGDIINNQLSFSTDGVTLRGYRDAAEYVKYYPFAPYQFTLLSKIFEAIRRHGATGKHLSKGERSLLDAFQTAAKSVLDETIDCMVPLYEFYPSIESFLESTVKHSIDNAEKEVGGLFEPFDLKLLKTLFLIKYIPEIIKGTIESLATLCVDEIDCDKLALKKMIQDSLARLEKQNLVNRNGNDWMFLTHEEQDIAREIGHEVISGEELTRKLASLVFEEAFKGQTKVRHRESKGDYEFNRRLDGRPFKNSSHELTLDLITELNDEYGMYTDAKCRMQSIALPGHAILKLGKGERLYEELQIFMKVEQYIASKYENASQAGKKILTFMKDENRERDDRLRLQLEKLLSEAELYAVGEGVPLKGNSPGAVLDETINYLVSNTYSKLGYLKPCANPFEEIRAVLTAGSTLQTSSLFTAADAPNALAMKEVSDFLFLKTGMGGITLEDVVTHFNKIPYGWTPDWEIVHLVARLFMGSEITLTMDNTPLSPLAAVEPLTKAVRFRQVSILKRKKTGALELKKARDLYKVLFAGLGAEDEDNLVADFSKKLQGWNEELLSYLALASQTGYPGKTEIQTIQAQIKKQLAVQDSASFIETMLAATEDWQDAEEDLRDLSGFYDQVKGQIHTWQRMIKGLAALKDNRDKLLEDPKAAAVLRELDAIQASARPYALINKVEALLATAEAANEVLAAERRNHALDMIGKKIATVVTDLDQINASPELRNQALHSLQMLRQKVTAESSVPQIYYLQGQASQLLDKALDMVAEHQAKQVPKPVPQPPSIKDSASGTYDPTAKAAVAVTEPSTAQVTIKPTKTVKAANLTAGKQYLESEVEVENYVSRLRDELLAVVRAGSRARIE